MCYTLRDRIASKKAEQRDSGISRQATAPKATDAQPVRQGFHHLLDMLTGKQAKRRVEKAVEEA